MIFKEAFDYTRAKFRSLPGLVRIGVATVSITGAALGVGYGVNKAYHATTKKSTPAAVAPLTQKQAQAAIQGKPATLEQKVAPAPQQNAQGQEAEKPAAPKAPEKEVTPVDQKAPDKEAAKPAPEKGVADKIEHAPKKSTSLDSIVSSTDKLSGGRHGVCEGYIGPVVYDNRVADAPHSVLFQAYGSDVKNLKLQVFVNDDKSVYTMAAKFTTINKMYHAVYSTENLFVDGKKATPDQESTLRKFMTSTLDSEDTSLKYLVIASDEEENAIASCNEHVREVTYIGHSDDNTGVGYVKGGIDVAAREKTAKASTPTKEEASEKSKDEKKATIDEKVADLKKEETPARSLLGVVGPTISVPYGLPVNGSNIQFQVGQGSGFRYNTLYVEPMKFTAPSGLNFNCGAFSFTFGDYTGKAKFEPMKDKK